MESHRLILLLLLLKIQIRRVGTRSRRSLIRLARNLMKRSRISGMGRNARSLKRLKRSLMKRSRISKKERKARRKGMTRMRMGTMTMTRTRTRTRRTCSRNLPNQQNLDNLTILKAPRSFHSFCFIVSIWLLYSNCI